MTKLQRDMLLAALAALPVFWWLIDGAATLGDLIKGGLVTAIAAGILLAIPTRDRDGGGDDQE